MDKTDCTTLPLPKWNNKTDHIICGIGVALRLGPQIDDKFCEGIRKHKIWFKGKVVEHLDEGLKVLGEISFNLQVGSLVYERQKQVGLGYLIGHPSENIFKSSRQLRVDVAPIFSNCLTEEGCPVPWNKRSMLGGSNEIIRMYPLRRTHSLHWIKIYADSDTRKIRTDSVYWFQTQKCLAFSTTSPRFDGTKSFG
jgi:hypothetical protein